MAADEWSQLLTSDLDRLFGKQKEQAETIQLKKGERRNVSVLFLDIKGFTAMSEKLDPEEVTQIIDNVFKVFTGEIVRYGGMVDKYIGDAIMALFGAKKASEDDAERAIRAALGILDRLSQVNRILAAKGIELGCRIGLNTGLVVAGEMGGESKRDFTVMGDTVNTASRLEHAAQVNTLLISDNTRAAAGDIFDYETLEPIMVKGKEKPIKVFRVRGVLKERVERWERDSLTKSRKYVGRAAEWAELEKTVSFWLDRPEMRPVPVVGLRADGGMGKSRMVHEFLSRGPCPRGLILRGKTISYTAAPYWVFVGVLKNLMGVQEGDAVTTVRSKWDELLERFSGALELDPVRIGAFLEREDYLAYLLGVARAPEKIKSARPEELKKTLFETFRVFLEAAAAAFAGADSPLYVVLDDLHWVDELSRELIDYLMEALEPPRRALIVGMFRPDYVISNRWTEGKNYSEVRLNPLSQSESVEMVEGMLNGLRLTPELGELVHGKSGGNPFYIEEITYALVDGGFIIPDDEIQPGNRLWVVNPTDAPVELPDTIHGMVQTRIDKLEEPVRDLLLQASVLGMDFTLDLLGRVHAKTGGDCGTMGERLARLQTVKMVTPRGGDSGAEAYVFVNALVQEVCYNTLLNYNKTVLHGLTGESIEEMFPEGGIPEDEHHRLAFHFERGEKADKALGYLESAGDQCADRFSNRAAIDNYTRLLGCLEKAGRAPRETETIRRRVLYKLAQIEYRVESLESAYTHFADCARLCAAASDMPSLCMSLTRAGEIDRILERPEKALAFFNKSLALAEKLGDDYLVADNLVNLGILAEEDGDYAGAMDYFKQALTRAVTDEQKQSISHYIFSRG